MLSNCHYSFGQESLFKKYNQKARENLKQPDSLKYYGLLLIQLDSDRAKYEGYYAIGYSYHLEMNMDSSIFFFGKAKNQLSNNQYSELSRVYRMMAISNIKAGRFDSSLSLVDQLYSVSIAANDSSNIATSYNTKGIIYKEKGEFNEAIENFVSAANIYEKIQSFNIVNSYINIGISYAYLDQNEISLKWFRKAYKAALKFENARLTVRAINNLGNHFRTMNLLDSSKHYLQLLTKEPFELEYHQKAVLMEQLALISLELDMDRDAESYLSEFRKLIHKKDDVGQLIEFHTAKAKLSKKRKFYERALAHCDSGISIAREFKFYHRLVNLLSVKTELFELVGNPNLALHTLQEYNQIRDSLSQHKDMAAIQTVISDFELKSKEKQLQTIIYENESKDYFIKITTGVSITLLALASLLIIKNRRKRDFFVDASNSDSKLLENSEITGNTELNLQNEKLNPDEDFITLKHKQVIVKSEIIYVKSNGHYVDIYVKGKEKPYSERYTLSQIEEQLNYPKFIRTHRSYLININKVKAILSNSIVLKTNEEIPLSRSYKKRHKDNAHPLFKK